MTEDDQHEIEQEFIASWDKVAQFFEAQSVREWLKSAPTLIAELRKQGYDRQLRAGTASWSMLLSRSRQYGLRNEQAQIWFVWDRNGGMSVFYHESPDLNLQFHHDKIEITPELENFLNRLLAQPID